MEERLNMGMKERDRLHAVRNVIDGRITQAVATKMTRLSERHVRRLCDRLRKKGAAAFIHGLRGHPSNNRHDEELIGQALSVLHDPLWEGFGPTFSQEKLAELHGIELGTTTVRRLMLLTDIWQARRRRAKHRAWRERRPCVGMLVQLDGSDHDWFEGRGPRCALIIYIDDATSRILYGEFAKVEDTLTLMRTTRTYLRRWGRPVAFYVDKDSIYNVNRPTTVEEELRDEDPITQFERAMGELSIEIILAHSPQAKGRVERGFGTHQDRLVKELRLAGISTMEDANKFLSEVYIPKHNRRFEVAPASLVDVHKPLLRSHDLDAILSVQEDRKIHNDFIVRSDNRFFQVSEGQLVRPRTTVTVQQRLDGSMRIVYRGRQLRFKQVQGHPYRPEQLRRAKPKAFVPRLAPARLGPNPFYAAFRVGSSDPINPPASAALS